MIVTAQTPNTKHTPDPWIGLARFPEVYLPIQK